MVRPEDGPMEEPIIRREVEACTRCSVHRGAQRLASGVRPAKLEREWWALTHLATPLDSICKEYS